MAFQCTLYEGFAQKCGHFVCVFIYVSFPVYLFQLFVNYFLIRFSALKIYMKKKYVPIQNGDILAFSFVN